MPLAKQNLSVNGVLAHTAGDFVPPANVEPNGWGDLVEDSPELDQMYEDRVTPPIGGSLPDEQAVANVPEQPKQGSANPPPAQAKQP